MDGISLGLKCTLRSLHSSVRGKRVLEITARLLKTALLSALAKAVCLAMTFGIKTVLTFEMWSMGSVETRRQAKLAEFDRCYHEYQTRDAMAQPLAAASGWHSEAEVIDDDTQRCSICFDAMDDTQNGPIHELPCHVTHCFHAGCLARCWKASGQRGAPLRALCPMCRQECAQHHLAQVMDALAVIEMERMK